MCGYAEFPVDSTHGMAAAARSTLRGVDVYPGVCFPMPAAVSACVAHRGRRVNQEVCGVDECGLGGEAIEVDQLG